MGRKRQKESTVTSSTVKTGVADEKDQQDFYSQIFAGNTTDSELDEGSSSAKPAKGRERSKQERSSKISVPSPQKSSRKRKTEDKDDKKPKKVSSKKQESKSGKVRKNMPMPSKQVEVSDESSDNEPEDYEFDEGIDDDDKGLSDSNVNEDVEDSNNGEEDESEGDSDESENETDNDDAPKTALRKQLKDLSFEELESLKQKMGLKEYNEAMFASKTGSSSKNKRRRKFERLNKHRPKEISSKVRVPKMRQVVKVTKKLTKDPRFDNSCGEFDEKIWNTEYGFIRDIQKKEAEEMKKSIKLVDDKFKKRDMRRFIQRVTDKEKSISVKQHEEQKRKQEKEENRKRVQEGKRPFYMKKSTKKLSELVEKYDELKASGKLDSYLKKKRKKNAIRDNRTLTG